MVIHRLARVAAAFLLVAAIPLMRSAGAHPIHSSLAEITHEPSTRTVRVSLRVFVDDYTTASSAYARRLASSGTSAQTTSPLVLYAIAAFALTDRSGRRVALKSCGGRRAGEVMWLCFRASVPRGLSGYSVASMLLFDLFDDQVNIVQISNDGKRTSMLFTKGDKARRIP